MYRIRIKQAPRMEEGGSVKGVRTQVPEVDPSVANIEAERGETIVGDFDGDALHEHYEIGGQRHSQGGTPLLVPEGSFVFSDTKKLKIGGQVLAEFGKNPNSKRKYTPAELAKQYNVNKYKALLGSEMSDKYDKDTAQVMLDSYERKLAKLALLQEGMKGFPQGVPAMAVPLLAELGIQLGGQVGGPMMGSSPQGGVQGAGPMPMPEGMMGMPPMAGMEQGMPLELLPPGMEGMPPGMAMGPEAGMLPPGMPMPGGMEGPVPMARYGGLPRAQLGAIVPALRGVLSGLAHTRPKVPIYGGDKTDARSAYQKSRGLDQGFNKFFAPWLPSYGYEASGEGFADALIELGYEGDFNDIKEIQKFLIRKNVEKGNYQLFNDLMEEYGLTTQGRKDNRLTDAMRFTAESLKDPKTVELLESNFADPNVGARTGYFLWGVLPKKPAKQLPGPVKGTVKGLPVPHPNEFTVPDARAADIGMPWWIQDQLNEGASLRQLYNLTTDMPTLVRRGSARGTPNLVDYTRGRVEGHEAANAQNMYAAQLGSPQIYRAATSQVLGQDMANAAKLWGQEQAQNVGLINQFELANLELASRDQAAEQEARKLYLDEEVIARQQGRNARALAEQNVLNNLNAGITNSLEAYWLNRMNNQFQIDPATGRLYFLRGSYWTPLHGYGTGSGRRGDYFAAYKKHQQEGDPNDYQGAREYAQWMSGISGKGRSDDDDGMDLLKMYMRGKR